MTLSPRLDQPTGNRPDNHRMNTTQTASIRLHPPAHAGVSTGEVGSGFFAPMKNLREARPTQYKGIIFRSKTEALYARAFDLTEWPWDYEPEIQDWPHKPDFLLSVRTNTSGGALRLAVVEIKPSKPTAAYLKSITKAATKFASQSPMLEAYVLYGNPWDGGDVMCQHFEDGDWQDPKPFKGMMDRLIEAENYRFDLI